MAAVTCLITDRRHWGDSWGDAIVAQVAAAARNGVSLIQVREPDLDGGVLLEMVTRCCTAVQGTRTRILVNERVDVARAAGAHGVHLRGDSMPASRVRGLCPRPFLIGRSIHSVVEARDADCQALDYLIFGTVFATPSKPGREPAGIETLSAVVAATRLPVLAVGGISRERIPDVMRTGAAGVAGIAMFTEDYSGGEPRTSNLEPRTRK